MLKNLDKIMHLRFNLDVCPVNPPFGFVHLTHQNLSTCALFCLNSLVRVNTQFMVNVLVKGFVAVMKPTNDRYMNIYNDKLHLLSKKQKFCHSQ